jgi:uncharacterized protein involved in outer membrane biogenesis
MDIARMISPSRAKKIALWLAGLFVLFGVVGFLVVPPLAKSIATEQLGKFLGRPVSIGEIAVNPYTLTATVRNFEIREPAGDAVAARFDELFVNLQAESLFRGGAVVAEARLVNPRVSLVRKPDKTYNWSDLIEKILSQPESEPTSFSVNNIQVSGGRIEFDDQPLKSKHTIADLALGLPFLSNLPAKVDIYVEPSFKAVIDGAPLALTGKLKPFKDVREATIDLDLDGLDLPRYLDYVPVPLAFSLAGGKLDSRLVATFAQPQTGAPSLSITGSAAVKALKAVEKSGAPVLEFAELALDLKSLDVFGGRAEVNKLLLRAPDLSVRRLKDGSISLLALLPRATAAGSDVPAAGATASAAPKPAAAPFRYQVGEIRIADGRVHFADETVGFETRAQALELSLRNVGNAPGQSGESELSLETARGEKVRHAGSFTLEPLAAKGRLEVSGVQIPNYAPYYASQILFRITRGTVGLASGFDFAMSDGAAKISIDGLGVELNEVALQWPDEKDAFYRLARAELSGGKLDLAARSVAIDQVAMRDARVQVVRGSDGTLSVQHLFPVSAAVRAAGKAEQPWSVDIGKVITSGYDILFEDRALPQPARLALTGIRIAAENVSNRKGQQTKFEAEAKVNRRGSLKLGGSAGIEPRRSAIRIDARGIEILPFQPYFADRLNLTLTRGAVSVRGDLVSEVAEGGAPKLGFRGDATVADLHTVDSANASDLLVWKSLFFGGINLSRVQPLALDIREVALSDFYTRLIISPEGRFNLQQIVKAPADTAAAGAPAAAAAAPAGREKAAAAAPEKKPAAIGVAAPAQREEKITVQKATLQGGKVNFTDLFIRPNYSAELVELGGQVAGLSSDLGTTADVELRGKVNDAPLEILGRINPLAGNLFLDIKAGVKGMELAPLSPYSGRYAGYAIEKGKLSVNLAYKVENQKLEAQNNVFLDQLTFGDKVDSPDATKLPVQLAVSLLKDRNGVIDINLPVSGSLDDPQFSVGGIIVRVIVNLITKALTAPFSLLASAFGGGEELSYVEFAAGRHALDAAGEEKMRTLAKALNDRPALKVEIAGRVDPEADREGLKRAAVERDVKAQKLRATVKGGDEAGSLDKVQVTPEEYPRYLEAAYKVAKFPKPRNLIGLAKDLPPAEMEKLMLANAEVGEEDLRLLANRRAQAAKDFLVGAGKVADERVFIVAPKLGAGEAKDKASAQRADFSLK